MSQTETSTQTVNNESDELDAKVFLDPRLVEALAEFEHEQWMAWARNLLEKEPNISEARKQRWAGLLVPYADLSEEMKEADREWARGVGKIVIGALFAGKFICAPPAEDPKT